MITLSHWLMTEPEQYLLTIHPILVVQFIQKNIWKLFSKVNIYVISIHLTKNKFSKKLMLVVHGTESNFRTWWHLSIKVFSLNIIVIILFSCWKIHASYYCRWSVRICCKCSTNTKRKKINQKTKTNQRKTKEEKKPGIMCNFSHLVRVHFGIN